MANSFLTATTVALILFVVQQVFTEVSNRKRALTPEEEALADDARSEIAKVLERNLIKFFTLVAADNGRELFGRQDDDDDDGGATLNPTVLPQVAQILGTIFGGGLNISKVVDQSFNLASATIRNQVEGIFKLLTETGIITTTTPAPTTTKPRRRKKTTPLPEDYDLLTTESTTTTTRKATRYTLRNKNPTTVRPSGSNFLPDEEEELYRLEEEVISAAIDAEPYVRDRQPRFILGSVREILANFDSGRLNLTQVIRFLPDLFVGARQAFTLLENLGQLAGIDLDDD
ncbi:unnamed protein product [Allacma fusca]|uniref:Uncharacterized protein n=1 Tax=Allacma fusca TaxID=39272 RepID=A0A8J2LFW4_9HEXA|nr:unnamed protein product [Allacma fusca]